MNKGTKINMLIEKNTANDKRRMLSDALDSGWVLDYDETYIYVEQWDNVNERYTVFRRTYDISEGNLVTFGDEKEPVVATTDFKLVEGMETDKSILTAVTAILDKYLGATKKEISVIKQFGTDTMTCVEPLYTAPLVSDGDGDMMDADTIENMVTSINKANEEGRLQSGLFHKHSTSAWSLEKAWVNPTECMIGDTLVAEGQPIAETVFHCDKAFELRKSGDIAGLSIGARAKGVVDLTKSLEELQKHQKTMEATRQIVGTHFDWDHPELTYTSAAQGGAAHMHNEPYDISKAKKATVDDLLPEEMTILKEIGEEFVSLEKHLDTSDKKTPSSSATARVGEDTSIDKQGNESTMSDTPVTREEFVALQKALAVSKAENTLMSYGFDAELNKSLAAAIADLETSETITKAFDVLIARSEEAVTKAKEAAPEADTDFQKALDQEQGEGGEPEAEVEKSFLDKIAAHQDKGAK